MSVSRISYSVDDDFPQINWNRHARMGDLWLRIDQQHKSGAPIDDLLAKMSLRCSLNPKWPRIDCISMSPGLAVSVRAKEALEALSVPSMQFLPFKINDQPFFMFYTDRRIDCLDRTRSLIEHFPSSTRVMRVRKYAFVEDRLLENDVFTVPELSNGMFFWVQETFFTGPARATVESAGLSGLDFEEVAP